MSEEQIEAPDELQDALDAFLEGRLSDAERLCRSVVAGAQYAVMAVRDNLLGQVLAAQGRTSEAVAVLHTALKHAPAHPGISFNLGNVLAAERRFEEALPHLGHAARLAPQYPEAHLALARCHAALGKLDEAVAGCRRALALDPGSAGAHCLLGDFLKRGAQYEEAATHLQRAIDLKPDLAVAHRVLGDLHYVQQRFEAAGDCYRRALDLEPANLEALNNLGSTLRLCDRFREAEDCFRQLVERHPGAVAPVQNLANILFELRKVDEAEAYFRRTLEMTPSEPMPHFGLGVTLLLKGNYIEGWREYEWRSEIPSLKTSWRRFHQPLWRGEDISGKTILLHPEQGFGDTLHFVRYAPLVAQRGARVVLGCQQPLARLLGSVSGIDRLLAEGEAPPPFDVHCPLLSLPLAFGTTLESIPAAVPYIHADSTLRSHWQRRLGSGGELKVGLVWSGLSGQTTGPFQDVANRRRNMSLPQLAPLARVKGVVFFSLQVGPAAAEAAEPPPGMRLVDYTTELGDFADTAALIANLDLVITVDTAVAHLAGAMAKPVWIFVNATGDWRYLIGREDNPWYPTARIFRQLELGNWSPAVEKLARALEEEVRHSAG